MVAQAATTPLPQLSKPDKLRLTLYFAGGQSTEALAQTLLELHQNHQAANPTNPRAPIPQPLITENTALAPILSSNSGPGTRDSALPDAYDLAAWTLSPEISPHIAYRRAELAERRKQTALAELDTILATSTNPIEKSRAATTMLRMLQNPRTAVRGFSDPPSPAAPPPAPPPPPVSVPGCERAAAVRRDRGGEGSVSASATRAPSSSKEHAEPHRAPQPNSSLPPHLVTLSPPPQPLPLPPTSHQPHHPRHREPRNPDHLAAPPSSPLS